MICLHFGGPLRAVSRPAAGRARIFVVSPQRTSIVRIHGAAESLKRRSLSDCDEGPCFTAVLPEAIGEEGTAGKEAHASQASVTPEHTDTRADRPQGATPLIAASQHGLTAIVRELLNAGAKVEVKDQDGCTALIRAAQGGHSGVVRELLGREANVNATDQRSRSALHAAAISGHPTVVRELLLSGANAEIKDEDDWTPLHHAAFRGCYEAVWELLRGGADVHAQAEGTTPLHMAAELGHTDVVQELLEAGKEEKETGTSTP